MYVMVNLVRIFVIGIMFTCRSLNANEVKVAAIDWCPQICPEQENKGYIVEIMEAIFEHSDYRLTIQYFPWSRAIKGVEQGSFEVLLAPAKKEAPHLVYPEQPIGFQQMCFFTLVGNPWQYTGPDSLLKQRVGIAIDTSIVELNEWRLLHPEVFQYQPYHERFIKQNVGKLSKHRIDSFIFTRNSTNYSLKVDQVTNVRNAGCVGKEAVYSALTPSKNTEIDIDKLKVFIDKRLIELSREHRIKEIKSKYAIE